MNSAGFFIRDDFAQIIFEQSANHIVGKEVRYSGETIKVKNLDFS